jgi:ubiquinone/menaquinone biosynthesis C-methylase UbiE
MAPRTRVFISYSHKDRAWLERLKVFLRPLERQDLIDRWDDTLLAAGDDWRAHIREAIASAKVIVLLVSADFLASDFIDKEELPPLLDQAALQGARILPVIVGHCMLEGPNAPLARYQAINSPSEPLENQTRAGRNRVWTKLTEKIFAELARSSSTEPAPAAAASPVEERANSLPERHALVIVNDNGTDRGHERAELARVLGGPEMGKFQVTVLQEKSPGRVRETIRRFFTRRHPNDLVLLVYSALGHTSSSDGKDAAATSPPALDVFDLQAAMKSSRARWQILLLQGDRLIDSEDGTEWDDIARFQGEGRFVLALRKTTNGSNGADVDDGELSLAGHLVYGLQSGKADVDGDGKVSVEDLFQYVEKTAEVHASSHVPVRWAFDQSNADVVIANVSLAGQYDAPTPLRVRDRVTQDIRHPIFDLTVPTYILDPYFYILDWNPAFDELIAKDIQLVRGQNHARSIVQNMSNCDESFRHAQEAFGGDRYPLVDTEPLVFMSKKYGELRFQKVAAQIANDDGSVKGWSVTLNILADGGDRMWQALKERIEEEVGWSRYGAVYDRLLLEFDAYLRLLSQMTGLVGNARRCIDLGAGTGNGAIELLKGDPTREVWAVEINETMLRHFRSKLEGPALANARDRLTVVKDDVQRLDALPRASFDAAIMTNVLYAVRDREACLRQVNRILKPNGVFALSTSHRDTSVERLFDALRRALQLKGIFDEYQGHFDAARARHDAMMDLIKRDTVEDTVRMLKEAGFDIEQTLPEQYVGAVVIVKAVKAREPREATVSVPAERDIAARTGPPALELTPPPATAGEGADEQRDVFVSYSAEDRDIAQAIRAQLEQQAIRCWIAPRDILPGSNFAAAIVNAIDRSRVLVLVLSKSANRSQYAAREVARAAAKRIPIIPYRAEDVVPSQELALYLSNVHWLDAFDGPTDETQLARLSGTIKELLSSIAGETAEAQVLEGEAPQLPGA